MTFDLLSTVEYGGCSAKLSPKELASALADLPASVDPNLLVDISTHDDAGVYRISDDVALIQTTDFFPPICSDPYEFGQIAAANALSDVYAMGGKALTAMNIVMFPSTRISLDVLKQMLRGGTGKVLEAGAVVVGGHTIDDYPPKYGLAVTGVVHPKRVITNAAARPGEILVLSKPLGTGVIVAGRRLGLAGEAEYHATLESMKQLNRRGAEIMQDFGVQCATDVTGFGLLGHSLKLAQASRVTLKLTSGRVPLLEGSLRLADGGCIPGAAFRNLDFVDDAAAFAPKLDYNRKMLLADAQTSGGLLMCVKQSQVREVLAQLRAAGYREAAAVGEVLPEGEKRLLVV